MKKLLGILLISIAATLFVSGAALAIPVADGEYEIALVDPLGMPSYTPGFDLGYYIWADDANRHQWHLRWSGDTKAEGNEGANYLFSGTVFLTSKVLDGVTDTTNVLASSTFSFDSNDTAYTTDTTAGYFAFASTGHDGFDFEILGNEPGYIGFDLHITKLTAAGTTPAPISNFVKIGQSGMAGSEDFLIAAPVPEPASLILFGIGLVGLAGVGRKKFN